MLPVVAGLVGTLLPAFGILPAIGGHEWSLAAWRALFEQPGVGTSIRLSVQTGLLATLLSLGIALSFCALMSEHRGFRTLTAWVAPMLATPHVAIAVGFAFLAAPSGWIVRLVSPELTGWEQPPAGLVTVRDAQGIASTTGHRRAIARPRASIGAPAAAVRRPGIRRGRRESHSARGPHSRRDRCDRPGPCRQTDRG